MKKSSTTAILCGVVILVSLVDAPLFAAKMPGPGIVGTVAGGGSHAVELYADDGDEVLDADDVVLQIKSTESDGSFSFDNLDMDHSYFVRFQGQVSPLQRLGEIKSFIDTFDIRQSITANPVLGFRTNSAHGPLSSILGGVRDFYVDVLEGPAEAQLRSNPFSQVSNLQIDMAAGVSGMVSVIWDGIGGGMEPEHGLDVDLTQGGMYSGISLRLAVDRAGAGQMLKLLLHSADGVSEKEIEFPVSEHVSPADLTYVAFEDFVGDADPAQITAIQLMLDETMPSLDARISGLGLTGANAVSFTAAPEPTSGLLFLLGLGFVARRRVFRR